MKIYKIFAISFLMLISCNENRQYEVSLKKDYLSQWFIANEDSLYNEFIRYVAGNSLCDKCDTNWSENAYQKWDSTSFMGRFSQQVTKYCDSLQVTYFYNKNAVPKVRILLSTGFNRKFTKAIDTIFNYVPTPKHFKVDKYQQPETRADVLSINNTNVVVKDIRVQMTPLDTLENLIVYMKPNLKDTTIDNDLKAAVIHDLFGEEILLKRINAVTLVFCDSIKPNLLTINEARLKLK